jgi:hypothetical protein
MAVVFVPWLLLLALACGLQSNGALPRASRALRDGWASARGPARAARGATPARRALALAPAAPAAASGVAAAAPAPDLGRLGPGAPSGRRSAGANDAGAPPGDGPQGPRARAPVDGAFVEGARADGAPDAPPGAARAEKVSLGGGAVLLIPAGLAPEGGTVDLVVHFHGIVPPLERALAASGLRALFVDVNVGLASGPYAAVVREGAVNLDRIVAEVERAMAARGAAFASARVGRVALSAWSAGYGAVLRLLAAPRVAERVDAVLLADAPHASFRDRGRRQVDGAGLEPLLAFARRARRGEALLAITHSRIATPNYPSTSETNDFLLRALGVARRPVRGAGPGRMVPTSLAEEGEFSVAAFEGVDAPAHCDHLRHLDETLLPRLRRRWHPAPVERAALAAPAAP